MEAKKRYKCLLVYQNSFFLLESFENWPLVRSRHKTCPHTFRSSPKTCHTPHFSGRSTAKPCLHQGSITFRCEQNTVRSLAILQVFIYGGGVSVLLDISCSKMYITYISEEIFTHKFFFGILISTRLLSSGATCLSADCCVSELALCAKEHNFNYIEIK